MVWTASSWRVHKDQMRKHRQCLTQYPVHGRELTISQFFKNILISFHCPSFLLFLLFTQIYRHFASLHLCNHVSWVFQTGMLRLREKSGFPKVAQWSVEELGPGPSVGREERDSPSTAHSLGAWGSFIGVQRSQTPREVGGEPYRFPFYKTLPQDPEGTFL